LEAAETFEDTALAVIAKAGGDPAEIKADNGPEISGRRTSSSSAWSTLPTPPAGRSNCFDESGFHRLQFSLCRSRLFCA
jgi:hypothetical protein